MKVDSDNNAPVFSIGTVARLLEVSVHTLRLYEREGLILPFKKDSKHRLYSQNDIERLKCLRTAINENKFSISSIKTIYSLIPCWSIKKCPDEERESCPAFTGHQQPCWSFRHINNLCALQSCKSCEVYHKHTNCDNIKQTIINQTR